MPTLHNGPIDALLDAIATGTTMRVVSSAPTTRSGAITATLGSAVVEAADFSAITTYATNQGRQRVGPSADITFSADGTATHLCLDDGTDLLHVMPITATAITNATTRTVSYGTIRVPYAGTAA